MHSRWYFVLALALAHPCAAGDVPTVRPLDPTTEETAPTAAPEPARTLPPTVAICQEPAANRCWTALRAEDCARERGRVYRVVLGDAAGRDAAAAMNQCRTAVAPGR